VFIELKAKSKQKLKELQTDIAMELTRSKIEVDRLTLRQKEGFLSVNPIGSNQFGSLYERVLPASSVANLFPFNFSGKTDPNGLYIGRDKYGTNILVDFDRRTEDKTTSNILILGNSGQGKSYLLKLILTNIRESGKKIICLDPEAEYEDLTNALGGCYIDFMSGKYKINPLEPKA
jgi:type IV secretory pathway VirB4 component